MTRMSRPVTASTTPPQNPVPIAVHMSVTPASANVNPVPIAQTKSARNARFSWGIYLLSKIQSPSSRLRLSFGGRPSPHVDPTLSTIEKLAKALKVDVAKLLK